MIGITTVTSSNSPTKNNLTIQVNQNDQQQDVVNQPSGISIVNCYKRDHELIADKSSVVISKVESAENEVQIKITNDDHDDQLEKKSESGGGVDKKKEGKLNNGEVLISSANSIEIGDEKEKRLRENSGDHFESRSSIQRSANSVSVCVNNSENLDQTINISVNQSPNNQDNSDTSSKQFKSTEAQTDTNFAEDRSKKSGEDRRECTTTTVQATVEPDTDSLVREQRRRERRERRQLRNQNTRHFHPNARPSHLPPNPPPVPTREILPDLLHSHLLPPPPYSTLPLGTNSNHGPILSRIGPIPNPHLGMPRLPPQHPILLQTTPILQPISVGPIPTPGNEDPRYLLPLPVIRRSPSERSGKGCCGQWTGPPLRILIAVVALGGLACAISGAALGATGLTGSPSNHLTASLLMIGIGIILVTISGVAWRMTATGSHQCLGSNNLMGRCGGRRACAGRGGTSHGLLYPEFQHRPPPPSYQASMQEYRLRLLLLDRDRQAVMRGASPPPTYRSNNSSLLRIPLGILQRHQNGTISSSQRCVSPLARPHSTTSSSNQADPSERVTTVVATINPAPSSARRTTIERKAAEENNSLDSYTDQQLMGNEGAMSEDNKSLLNSLRKGRKKICVKSFQNTNNSEEKDVQQDLVTIVTISGNEDTASSPDNPSESNPKSDMIDILAHL